MKTIIKSLIRIFLVLLLCANADAQYYVMSPGSFYIDIQNDSVSIEFTYTNRGPCFRYFRAEEKGHSHMINDTTQSISIGWMDTDVKACANDSLVCACKGVSFKYPLDANANTLNVNICVLSVFNEAKYCFVMEKLNTVDEILKNDEIVYKKNFVTAKIPICGKH